eukprot:COSAG06_NODE_4156_length_4514_cov_196.806795_2_plen_102_part_00
MPSQKWRFLTCGRCWHRLQHNCVEYLPFCWCSSLVRQSRRRHERLSRYLLRQILVHKPKDLNRDWSPRFSTLCDKKKRLGSSQNGLKFEPRRVSKPFLRFI